MKRLFAVSGMFTCVVAAMMAFTSCEPEEIVREESSIVVDEKLNVGSEGGDFTVSYRIDNPVEGVNLVADCQESWIVLDVKEEHIALSVAPNEADSVRTAVVSLSYTDECSASFEVIQAAEESCSFDIDVDEDATTHNSVVVSVVPDKEDVGYFLMAVTAAEYDAASSDEDFFKGYIGEISASAAENGQSLSEYIVSNGLLESGNVDSKVIGGLSADTDYYVVVVGSDEEGKQLTDVFKEAVHTKSVSDMDISFDFDYEIDGMNVVMNVVPDYDDIYYYFDVTNQETLDEQGVTVGELAEDFITSKLEYAEINGIPVETVMTSICSTGKGTKKYELLPQREYIGYAFAVTLDGEIVSDVDTENFTTGDVTPSENDISIAVYYIGMDKAFLSVTTTNDDPYALVLSEKSRFDGMTASEIEEELLGGDVTLFEVSEGGDWSQDLTGLVAGTDYIVYAFGYDYEVMTTELFSYEFTTLAADDAYSFELDVEVSDIEQFSAKISLSATPDNVLYCFDVVENGVTKEEILGELEDRIERYLELGIYPDRLSYLNNAGTRGGFFYVCSTLSPDTEYVVWSVSVEEQNGDFAVFSFSEPFRTLPTEVSDVQMTVSCDKYFDVDELGAAYPGQFDYYMGKNAYCLPVDVEASGDVYCVFQRVMSGDLTDESEYSDNDLIADLEYDGTRAESKDYFLVYGSEVTLVVVAKDYFDKYTKVFRKFINYDSKEGAADVSEYNAD